MIDFANPDDWSKPLFPLVPASLAAGMALATLRKWTVRYPDLPLWGGDGGSEKAAGAGHEHRFSYRTILHIAAAAQLVAKGVQVVDAYEAAAAWAHIGEFDRAAVWGNEGTPVVIRQPAGLYALPLQTFLIHHRGTDARVVAVKPQGNLLPFKASDLLKGDGSIAPTLVALNLVELHARIHCQAYLGIPSTSSAPAEPIWDDASIAKLAEEYNQ